jgi:hypothetical protein
MLEAVRSRSHIERFSMEISYSRYCEPNLDACFSLQQLMSMHSKNITGSSMILGEVFKHQTMRIKTFLVALVQAMFEQASLQCYLPSIDNPINSLHRLNASCIIHESRVHEIRNHSQHFYNLVTPRSEVRGRRLSLLSRTFLHTINQPLCLTASTPLSSTARGKAALTNVKFYPRRFPSTLSSSKVFVTGMRCSF